ncbi:hypothetical protein POVWA2_050460 [Plasmodium ovale wallikeri]|uniref:Uncharacterized protein n=1 Tax=Plasmodium ovale wallikeri TaxID=864142 RepID=A0A1A8ZNI5_PLAOA|nr:hypothetical protein POVWA2_050460 [Plasmodium ovale wallikeri]
MNNTLALFIAASKPRLPEGKKKKRRELGEGKGRGRAKRLGTLWYFAHSRSLNLFGLHTVCPLLPRSVARKRQCRISNEVASPIRPHLQSGRISNQAASPIRPLPPCFRSFACVRTAVRVFVRAALEDANAKVNSADNRWTIFNWGRKKGKKKKKKKKKSQGERSKENKRDEGKGMNFFCNEAVTDLINTPAECNCRFVRSRVRPAQSFFRR